MEATFQNSSAPHSLNCGAQKEFASEVAPICTEDPLSKESKSVNACGATSLAQNRGLLSHKRTEKHCLRLESLFLHQI
jgi:hypothetical protein